MRHLRRDYEAIQPFPNKRPHWVKIDGKLVLADSNNLDALGKHMDPLIPEDEPVFLLRGADPVAAVTVREWADYAEDAGADPELVWRVRQWADHMESYYASLPETRNQVPTTPLELLLTPDEIAD